MVDLLAKKKGRKRNVLKKLIPPSDMIAHAEMFEVVNAVATATKPWWRQRQRRRRCRKREKYRESEFMLEKRKFATEDIERLHDIYLRAVKIRTRWLFALSFHFGVSCFAESVLATDESSLNMVKWKFSSVWLGLISWKLSEWTRERGRRGSCATWNFCTWPILLTPWVIIIDFMISFPSHSIYLYLAARFPLWRQSDNRG